MPDDDGEFQILLKEEASFPDVSSELPGVVLEDELVGPTTALDEEPEPDFEAQAAAALDNTDIQVDKQLRAARSQAATVPIVEARPDEILYEVEIGAEELDLPHDFITSPAVPVYAVNEVPIVVEDLVDEPDEGLHAPPAPPPIPDVAGYRARRYPTKSCRSVLGNRPCDQYLQFLQTRGILDDVEHDQDLEQVTQSEDEMAVMKYILTQYNLKAGLRHFGEKVVAAAEGKLTQLHVMDT